MRTSPFTHTTGMPKEFKSTFLKTLHERGFIHQCTDFAALDEVGQGKRPAVHSHPHTCLHSNPRLC